MLNRSLAEALISQGYTVNMANDISMTGKPDHDHLLEATKRGMVPVTLDRPFAGRTTKESEQARLICWTDDTQSIRMMLEALVEFAEHSTARRSHRASLLAEVNYSNCIPPL